MGQPSNQDYVQTDLRQSPAIRPYISRSACFSEEIITSSGNPTLNRTILKSARHVLAMSQASGSFLFLAVGVDASSQKARKVFVAGANTLHCIGERRGQSRNENSLVTNVAKR